MEERVLADCLPTTLWRVVYEQAVLYYSPERRRMKQRTFRSERALVAFIDALKRWPRHHAVLGVYRCDEIKWEPVDPAELPEPEERIDDDHESRTA